MSFKKKISCTSHIVADPSLHVGQASLLSCRGRLHRDVSVLLRRSFSEVSSHSMHRQSVAWTGPRGGKETNWLANFAIKLERKFGSLGNVFDALDPHIHAESFSRGLQRIGLAQGMVHKNLFQLVDVHRTGTVLKSAFITALARYTDARLPVPSRILGSLLTTDLSIQELYDKLARRSRGLTRTLSKAMPPEHMDMSTSSEQLCRMAERRMSKDHAPEIQIQRLVDSKRDFENKVFCLEYMLHMPTGKGDGYLPSRAKP